MSLAESTTVRRQVRQVLLITLALNLVVAFSKILIGVVSGALAITADGFHSLVDGSSNVVALVANRIAGQPPDAEHPYGHRRFETIAALAIGAFLLLTAWEIVGSALERLGGSGETPQITPLTFAVMLATLAVNLFITTYETRAGRRLQSELLMADAAHTRADVFVTLSVLVSMAGVTLLGWTWLDTAAALVIVGLIVRAAWQVLRQSGAVLVDKAPYTPDQIAAWVGAVPSIERVVRARSRGPADAAHVDVDVQVAGAMTADHTAAITAAIRQQIAQQVKGVVEVEVHFEPRPDGSPDYALSARAQADALGLATHEVLVSDGPGGRVMELHVEVPPGQTLAEAHERVSQLEQQVRDNLPDVDDVITHIEPALGDIPAEPDEGRCAQLLEQARALLEREHPGLDWHDLRATRFNGGYSLTAHVTLPSEMTVEAAHALAEQAELLLRTGVPRLERVTIHTEPPE